ncbi:MAG TPA: ankyrin repeat domain-containing protein [Parachlamydiaceae bacterium]|nr:ankyrin repeat domain-containing protein [Tatlockia sp.]HEV8052103.1 ankyrin repeat domain-containing protein [Parachlamydiaceae bacterium]
MFSKKDFSAPYKHEETRVLNKAEELLFQAVKKSNDLNANPVIGLFSEGLAGEEENPDTKPDLNIKDSEGNTLLHYAVKRRLETTVSRLLSKGVLTEVKDSKGHTPLVIAFEAVTFIDTDMDNLCYRPHEIIEALVNHGADITARDEHGDTCLHKAVRKNNYFALRALLSSRTDFTCLEVLGKNGLFPNPFHQAVFMGKALLVGYFLEELKINPNLKNPETGMTALHYAVQEKQICMIDTLIKAGADFTLKDKWQRTPLDIAKKIKCNEISEKLEDYCLSGNVEKTNYNVATSKNNPVLFFNSNSAIDQNSNQNIILGEGLSLDFKTDSSSFISLFISVNGIKTNGMFINEKDKQELISCRHDSTKLISLLKTRGGTAKKIVELIETNLLATKDNQPSVTSFQ